jgi:hypothetical protein
MEQKRGFNIEHMLHALVISLSLVYVMRILGYTESVLYLALLVGLLFMDAQLINHHVSKKNMIMIGAFSLLYGIVFVISQCIVFNGLCDGLYTQNYIETPGFRILFSVIPVTILAFVVVYNVYLLTQKHVIKMHDSTVNNQFKVWLSATCIIAVCWLPHLLAFYPGVIIGDSLSSIAQAVGTMQLWNHFPVVYTLFIKMCLKTGLMFGSINLGVFIYSFIQFLAMAAGAGYVVMWLYKHNINRQVCIMVTIFYSICGIFAGYAISMWKDPLFGVAGVLMSLFLMDVILSEGEKLKDKSFLIPYLLLGIFIIFWRNNGNYIFIAASIITIVVYRKKNIKRFVAGVLLVVITSAIITGPVYDALNIEKDTIVESFAVPIQQIAAVVVRGKELTEKQQEVIYSILPKDDWYSYTPALSDRIKFHDNFNGDYLADNVGPFLKVWAQLLVPNFGTYVKSYLMETMGFWRPGLQNGAGYFYSSGVTENEFGIYRTNILQKVTGYSFEEQLDVSRYFICSGTLVWIMLLIVLLLLLQKEKRKYIIMLLPAILTWATLMLATPIAYSFRYIFILGFGLPVYVLLPFLDWKKRS